MILINSQKEYYNVLYDCFICYDKVWGNDGLCKPFVPSKKSMIYYKINGLLVSVKQLLDCKFVMLFGEQEKLPF